VKRIAADSDKLWSITHWSCGREKLFVAKLAFSILIRLARVAAYWKAHVWYPAFFERPDLVVKSPRCFFPELLLSLQCSHTYFRGEQLQKGTYKRTSDPN
jgi:hypothetical protein